MGYQGYPGGTVDAASFEKAAEQLAAGFAEIRLLGSDGVLAASELVMAGWGPLFYAMARPGNDAVDRARAQEDF